MRSYKIADRDGGLRGDGAPVQRASQADRALAQRASELGDRMARVNQGLDPGSGSRVASTWLRGARCSGEG